MELGCLLGLFLVALIALAMFVELRRQENAKEKILVAIFASAILIFSIAIGLAVLQPGWFLEQGSFSNQVVNWGFLVLGISGLLFTIGRIKLKRIDKFTGILFSVNAISLIIYALYRMAQ